MKKIKLGDACEILNGFAFKSENYVGSGIRVIRISNVQKGYIEDNTPAFYPLETKGLEKYMLEEGDLLISLTGNVGRVAILEKEFMPAALNQRVACLRLKTDKLSKRYLFHILNSDFFEKQCIQYSKGVAQKNMSTAWLKDYEILLYSKEQQELIADILDKMHLIKKLRYYELQKLDELVKARFVEMFGDPVENTMNWPEIFIGDKCFVTKLAGFEYTQYIDYEESGEVVMVKAQNVKNGKLNRKDLSFISKKVSDSLPRSQLAPGDVVMTYVGANIGDVAVIDDVYKYHLAPNVAKIRPNAEVYNSIYFMYMLMLLNIYIVKNSADTAKAALGMEKIRKLKVFIPPLELQNQFASFVEEIDKSRLLSNHSLFLIKSITF